MLANMDSVAEKFEGKNVEVHCPDVVQTLSEESLLKLVPEFDGWIVGDDPATRKIFEAGRSGRLRAVVKWGIGMDNIDLSAAKDHGIPVQNTPSMFGREVADLAMSYITALARDTFVIDRGVRADRWPKPCGISLKDKIVGLIGYGDIGKNIAKRAIASEMRAIIYDPAVKSGPVSDGCEAETWPNRLGDCDFIVLACPLTPENRHLLNAGAFSAAKNGVRVVNVARGPLIDESALVQALESGKVHSAALEVMELEPLPKDSRLRRFEKCIFGSHNASNTTEAVHAASVRAIDLLFELLGVK
jgi:D-3-phosphoglycerate dehydrogenase